MTQSCFWFFSVFHQGHVGDSPSYPAFLFGVVYASSVVSGCCCVLWRWFFGTEVSVQKLSSSHFMNLTSLAFMMIVLRQHSSCLVKMPKCY